MIGNSKYEDYINNDLILNNTNAENDRSLSQCNSHRDNR